MKRIPAIFLTAVLAFSAVGCELKKSDSEVPADDDTEIETEIETGEDTPIKTDKSDKTDTKKAEEPMPEFRELTEEDFSPIDFQLEVIDDAPPEEIKCADLTGLDFGEHMSPCKAEDVRGNYGTYLYTDESQLEPEAVEKRLRMADEVCSKPCKGHILETAYLDGYFYFNVCYDDYCVLHDSAIFRFDPKSGKYDELYAFSGLEYKGMKNLCAYDGKLYFADYALSDDDKSTIYSYDLNTGECSVFAELSKRIDNLVASKDGLVAESYVFEDETDTYSFEGDMFDYETGNLAPVSEGIADKIVQSDTVYCDGKTVKITGGYDGFTYRPVTVRTQYYEIKTDLKQYTQIFAWKDKLCILNDETERGNTSVTMLYTYDLKTMDRTKTDVHYYVRGLVKKSGNGFFICAQMDLAWGKEDSTLYYMIPEMGALFKVGQKISYPMIDNSDDSPYVLSMNKPEETDEYSLSAWAPEKIYWIDE